MSHDTGYEVPSNDILDFSDNCENFDVLLNADQDYWTTRLGDKKPTVDYALRMAGFTPAGFDFATGGVLKNGDRNKCVFNQADQTWYSWSGDLPYNVIAGSVPGEGWKVHSKNELFSHEKNYSPGTIGARLKNTIYITDFPYNADNTGSLSAVQAIHKALDDCPFGWTVIIPPGKWLIDSKVTIPKFKRLSGSGWTLDPSNTALYGSVLMVTFGENTNNHAVEVSHSSCLENVMFYYPEQSLKTSPTPKEYGYSISTPLEQGVYDNIKLNNIILYNSYKGIRLNNAGRFNVSNVIGNPLKQGFTADNCLDACYLEKVHFWNFYTQNELLENWVSNNSIAFEFRRVDQLFASKLFGWNHYECFSLRDGFWGNLTDILCDKATIPCRIEAPGGQIQINNFTFIGNAKATPAIWGRECEYAKFSNGRITDTCSVGAQLDDGDYYSFDNVQFDNLHSAVVCTNSLTNVKISDTCAFKTPPFGQYNVFLSGERLPGRTNLIELPVPWLTPGVIQDGHEFDLSTNGVKQLAFETTNISQLNGLFILQFDYELINTPTTWYFHITIKNDVGGEIQVSHAPLSAMILNGGKKTVYIPIFINHGRFKQSIFIDAVVTAPTPGGKVKLTNIKLWEQGNKLTTDGQVSNLIRNNYNFDAFGLGQTLKSKGKNRIVFTDPEPGIGRPTIVPTYGTWSAGDEIIAVTPVLGSPYRVICITSGNPGVWKVMEILNAG